MEISSTARNMVQESSHTKEEADIPMIHKMTSNLPMLVSSMKTREVDREPDFTMEGRLCIMANGRMIGERELELSSSIFQKIGINGFTKEDGAMTK